MAARRRSAGGGNRGGSARKGGVDRPKGASRRRGGPLQAEPKPAGTSARSEARPPGPALDAPRRVAAARPVPVGRIAHYYAERGAARLALEGPIRRGDLLHIRGQTTDFLQAVEGLRRDGRPVKAADAAQAVTLAVAERVRPGDRVYRLELCGAAEPSS